MGRFRVSNISQARDCRPPGEPGQRTEVRHRGRGREAEILPQAEGLGLLVLDLEATEDPSSEARGVAAPPSRGRGQQKNIEQEILKNLIL